MDLSKITVTILVKDAGATITQCLNSVAAFGEIIVLENGSTDDSLDKIVEFAQKHGNLHIHHSEFIGFGPLKNLAVSHARNDWIFSIDADEVLEPDCLEHIRIISLQPNEIGAVSRKNLYRGEWIKACGWSPDYVMRLFNRREVKFNQNRVHESLVVREGQQVFNLNGHLKHYAFEDISSLLDKLQRYSTLWAEQNLDKDVTVPSAMRHAQWNFWRNYVLKKGITYGYKGFIISLCNALGTFFKYMKLYEIKKTRPKSVSLVITTYNSKERLSLTLDSVKNQVHLPDEVIVADDGSGPDTRELIDLYRRDFPCPLLHVWHDDRGFRAAKIRNEAFKKASCEYIICVDGDLILDKYFVQDHMQRAVRGQYLQGNRILLNPDETNNIMFKKQNSELSAVAYRDAFLKQSYKARRNGFLSYLIYKYSLRKAKFFRTHDMIRSSKGCNFSFYKEDGLKCGFMDERYVGWGREDSDFVARFLFAKGVYRRLKFMGLAYHLYHEERSRDQDSENLDRYLSVIESYRNGTLDTAAVNNFQPQTPTGQRSS